MVVQNPPRKKYPPVGRCIYCGRTDDLTDEHILALSLGGREVLEKASCRPCAAITRDIEQFVAVDMLKPVRTKLKMRSRRKKPTHFRVKFVAPDGTETYEEVLPEDHPSPFVLVQLPTPGILERRPPARFFTAQSVITYFDPEAQQKQARKEPLKKLSIPMKFHPGLFCRVLAKTAYAYAVAEVGLDNFQPLVVGLILDGSETPTHLVGSNPVILPADRTMLHQMSIGPFVANDRRYIIVDIRLFAQFGGSIYRVVVGEQGGPVFNFGALDQPVKGDWYWWVKCRQCRDDFKILDDPSKGTWNGLRSDFYVRVSCPHCGARSLYTNVETRRFAAN